VEGGVTNVCGLGPERALQRIGFDYDSLLWGQAALRERMEGLRRATEWLSVGPLVFHNRFQPRVPDQLVAGDALQFVDPFTGSGMAAALYGGAMAGIWAAESRPVSAFFRQMEQALGRQYLVSGVLRRLVGPAAASGAAAWIPPAWLFRLTRPSFSGL
jgi:menaquinone-9 beta-reductase